MTGRDPLGRGMRCDFVAEYAPIGLRLHFETNSAGILHACDAAFARYGPPPSDPGVPRFSIRLMVDPAFTEQPPWPDAVVRGRDALLYISVGRENTAVTDLDRHSAAGFVAPAMAEDPAVLVRTFLECLVFTMATNGSHATHTYVHASAVSWGETGLVFAGPREAGKSTLAYALARSGFEVVTDDVLYLNYSADRLKAWGKPWRLRFLPDSVRFFPELNGFVTANKQGVYEIEVECLLPGQVRTCCLPRALFFLDRGPGRPACEAMDPEEAVERLMQDLICDAPETVSRHRRNWERLAGQGAYTLRYGPDLDAAVTLVRRLVHADCRI